MVFKKECIPWNKGKDSKIRYICNTCNKIYFTYSKNSKFCSYKCINVGRKLSEETKIRLSNLKLKDKTIIQCYKVIYRNGKHLYLHREIWKTKYGKIPKNCIIHHEDGNKLNNDINNLKLMTISEHMRLHSTK